MARKRPRSSLILPVMALALVGAACGGGAESPGASPSAPVATTPSATAAAGTVNATVKDFSITLDPIQVAAGVVKFSITNEGPSAHEFVVFRTDFSPDQLPIKEGVVDEEGQGLNLVDEQEDIASGTTATLTIPFFTGDHFVVICNLSGHYQQGMHAALTVT
jgi:uncharacterized cupredoxin-like copper-binding protein